MAQDALQCGFCTPGFIVEAKAFYDEWRATRGAVAPSREEIGAAFSGHLCRCGAYDNIYRAVADACAGVYDHAGPEAPRIEARDKVTGAAVYTLDIRRDGQLEGAILRSPHARARVVALDLAPAEKLPGVKAAVSLLDANRTVSFVGDAVAAVAAADRETAERALAAIRVQYEPLTSAIGPEAALAPSAAIVFPRGKGLKHNAGEGGNAPASWSGNLRGPVSAFSLRRKAAQKAIAAARATSDPLLVEGVFRTSAQQHNSLEPHVAVAHFDGDDLTVEVSTQGRVRARHGRSPSASSSTPPTCACSRVHVGGGFGSKGVLGLETIAAVELARAARAPVRVAYSRHEELSVAGYRPAVELKLALLPSRDGALKALSLTAYSDAGVAANNTVAGLARLIYSAEAKELVDYDVISDLPPGSPFRGPGGPPMAFALEQAIDEAALRLGSDPIALRKRWDPNPTRARLYDWAMGLEVWKARPTPPRRGTLSARRRRRRRLLALSVAGRHESRTRGRGRPARREPRRAGHWHRHPHGHRRHSGARIRSRPPGNRSAARRFEAAARPGLRRQPRDGLDRAGAARSFAEAEGARASLRQTARRRRAPTRRGANGSPPRPISR